MKLSYLLVLGLGGLLLTSDAIGAVLGLSNATATYSQTGGGHVFAVGEAIDGVRTSTYPTWNGWAINGNSTMSDPPTTYQAAAFETVADAVFGGRAYLRLIQDFTHNPGFSGQDFHELGCFRISYTTTSRDSFADGQMNGGNVGAAEIWHVLTPRSVGGYFRDGTADSGLSFTSNSEGSILTSGSLHRGYYDIVVDLSMTGVTGFRLEALPDASLPYDGPGRDPHNGNFVLTEFEVSTDPFELLNLGPADPQIFPPDGSAVPEPTTIITGALLLLPLAAGFIRRRNSQPQETASARD